MSETILITGGTGFIGSHTSLELLKKGYHVVLIDNFINSSPETLGNIKNIINLYDRNLCNNIRLCFGDLRDKSFIEDIFNQSKNISGVIHFAGLKSVSESILNPLEYWDSNLIGTINLLRVMDKFKCKKIVFSSSATVYGIKEVKLLRENIEKNPIHPYGETKNVIEKILENIYKADPENWRIINLRYFNPIGAHPSGLIGENPKRNSENLFPILCEVALKIRKDLKIFGNDWPTIDGTCERDFIHIMDIAEAHSKAIELLFSSDCLYESINLGTGKATSVLQFLKIFEKVNKLKIQFTFASRRIGDVPLLCADVSKAEKILGWKAKKNIEEMCFDGWNWYLNNLELKK